MKTNEPHTFEPKTNLQRERMRQGLTQRFLAERSGVGLRMIQDLEQGHKNINKTAAETVVALAHALHVPIEDIMDD